MSIEATSGALGVPREALVEPSAAIGEPSAAIVEASASILEPRDAVERDFACRSVPSGGTTIPKATDIGKLRA